MSNSLDPDQARQFVGPDLGSNCLQRLNHETALVDRVKPKYTFQAMLSRILRLMDKMFYALFTNVHNQFLSRYMNHSCRFGISGTPV